MKAWLTLEEERRLRKPVNRSAHCAWGAAIGLATLLAGAPWASTMQETPVLGWIVAAGAGWAWEMGWWLAHGCDWKERASMIDLIAWIAGAAAGIYAAVRFGA